MNKILLPKLNVARQPGLSFRPPQRVWARWSHDVSLKAAAEPAPGEISILGEIGDEMWGGVSAGMVKAALDALGPTTPVSLLLNSPGGDAFEGVAIYNLLREHKGKVTVSILGLAASAASVVAMAGDRIEMGEAAFLMIHSAWGVVMGNRSDMRDFADVLDQLDQSVAALYARRSGRPVADVIAMMEKETWLTADEAVKQGFADFASVPNKDKAKAKASAAQVITLQASAAQLAALGDRQRSVALLSAAPLPGASGKPPQSTQKGNTMKTILEQIAEYEAKRQASDARRLALMQSASDQGRVLSDEESEEYDALDAEVTAIDKHLVRMRALDKANKANITPAAEDKATPRARQNSGIISVKANLEPGQKMARFAMALKRAKGNLNDALSIVQNNKSWMDTSPELAQVFMTAVAAGDTTTAGWASELVYAQNLANEFIEYLRPKTIIGQITGFRRVPFNVRMGSMTSGTTGYWVGQGKPVPMSKPTTSSQTLGMTKAAGLTAIDDELVRSSSPSAELLVRDDLGEAVIQIIDTSFIDPNNGGVANVSPASVLYGVTPTSASGTTEAAMNTDIKATFAPLIAADLDATQGVWIMTPTTALSLSLMKNALGQNVNTNMSIKGGTFMGLPVVVSRYASISGSPDYGNMLILILPQEIFMADDGQVTISISNEASIEMLDNPTNTSTGSTTATSMVSMFQTNTEAIKAVRYINWAKRRSTAAQFIRTSAYV